MTAGGTGFTFCVCSAGCQGWGHAGQEAACVQMECASGDGTATEEPREKSHQPATSQRPAASKVQV